MMPKSRPSIKIDENLTSQLVYKPGAMLPIPSGQPYVPSEPIQEDHSLDALAMYPIAVMAGIAMGGMNV